jgi:hypothetical protein
MSMISHFVEISPKLLKQLQQTPSLVATVTYPELSDSGLASDNDADAMIRSWSPAQQQYYRAVQSADADAIIIALKKLVPKKQWQSMQARVSRMTKEELLKGAADSRERLTETARGFRSILKGARGQTGSQTIPDGALGERLSIDKAWGGLRYLLCRVDSDRKSLGLAVLGGTDIGDHTGYGPARYLSPPRVKAVAAALSTVTHEALRQHYDAADMNAAVVYPGRWDDGDNNDSLDWLLHAFDELRHFYHGAADRGKAVIQYIR